MQDALAQRLLRLVAIALAMSMATAGNAQTPEPSTSSGQLPGVETAPRILPANSLVHLRVDEDIVSGVNARDSTFRMHVTEDVRVDDTVVIPAGTQALGEVVDSKKHGMLGKAGVLVLSARLIRLDSRDIRLHSALGAAGDNRTVLAMWVPFVYGDNATVLKGTEVLVHTASDERF